VGVDLVGRPEVQELLAVAGLRGPQDEPLGADRGRWPAVDGERETHAPQGTNWSNPPKNLSSISAFLRQ
jgi:hypothetical protein